MAKQVIDGKKGEKKRKSRNPVIEFDTLQMYFADPYCVDLESAKGSLTLYQPTIGNIVEMGEKKFYSSLSPLVTNTTSYKVMLWDLGVDWNDVSDFTLFTMLYKGISKEVSELLFQIDLSSFELCQKNDESEAVVLYNEETDTEINEEVYFHISQYLRECFQMHPEEKLTKDIMLKKLYIQTEKSKMKRAEEKTDDTSSSIQPIISACVNHPGFKYRLDELKKLHVYEFYDSVKRLQIYENSTALLKGMYSGMVDSSKIPAESYNFMR